MAFGKGHHLHLIDGSAFIFRAYHALPPLTRKSDGLPVGAVAGFCNLLWSELSTAGGKTAATLTVSEPGLYNVLVTKAGVSTTATGLTARSEIVDSAVLSMTMGLGYIVHGMGNS